MDSKGGRKENFVLSQMKSIREAFWENIRKNRLGLSHKTLNILIFKVSTLLILPSRIIIVYKSVLFSTKEQH